MLRKKHPNRGIILALLASLSAASAFADEEGYTDNWPGNIKVELSSPDRPDAIALPGELFSARHSVSHLSNAGLADWVAPSIVAYVDMAVARASDLRALAELHDGLREQVRRSPLCDAPRFGRALGAALRETWHDWCAQE